MAGHGIEITDDGGVEIVAEKDGRESRAMLAPETGGTPKEFDFSTSNLVDASPIDTSVVSDRINDRLGVEVDIHYRNDADRTPVINMDSLPDSVSESDLKNAIQKSHPRSDGDPT